MSKRPCQILEPALFQETATIPSPPPPPQLHAFSFPDRRFFPREARNTLPWPVLLPAPSLYVVVAVAKHGCGMDRAIVESLSLSLSLSPPIFIVASRRSFTTFLAVYTLLVLSPSFSIREDSVYFAVSVSVESESGTAGEKLRTKRERKEATFLRKRRNFWPEK